MLSHNSYSLLLYKHLSDSLFLKNCTSDLNLGIYSQTYAISSALKVLANDILENSDRFQEKATDIGVLCEAFNRDLILWIEKLFYEGAPSIDFLDNSIISNANMISSFIKEPQSQGTEVLDDIFDF